MNNKKYISPDDAERMTMLYAQYLDKRIIDDLASMTMLDIKHNDVFTENRLKILHEKVKERRKLVQLFSDIAWEYVDESLE